MNLVTANFSESTHTLGRPDKPETHETCTVYTYSTAKSTYDVVVYHKVLLFQKDDGGWTHDRTRVHEAIIKHFGVSGLSS